MQRPRDDTDRRYWPARLGGTGKGFTRDGKAASPVYYSALNPQGSLSDNPRPDKVTPDTVRHAADTVTPEAVKARARTVALLAMDRLVCQSDSMDVPTALNVLGGVSKFTEAVSERAGAGVTFNLGSLHLDALRAARPALSNSIGNAETVDAHILPNPANDNGLDDGNGPDTDTPAHQG